MTMDEKWLGEKWLQEYEEQVHLFEQLLFVYLGEAEVL